MIFYMTRAQAESMRLDLCLRCHKTRSIAFYQVTPQIPVVLSVSEAGMKQAVKWTVDLCTCQEQANEEEEQRS